MSVDDCKPSGSAPGAVQNSRTVWPDMLRIFSVIAVIFLHAGGAGFFVFAPASADWQVCNFYDAAARFGVPCFVMLSGMFMLDPAREYPLKKLLQKILRIAAAFFFWSAFYSFFSVIDQVSFGERPGVSGVLIIFARGFFNGYYHMWFLGMISGLYLITPFLRRLVRDEKLTNYFLLLAFIFVFAANVLHKLPESAAGKWLCMIIDTMEVELVAGYSVYFVWGRWLASHELTRKMRKIIYILGITGAFVTVAGNGIIGWYLNEIGTWTYDNLLPNVFLTATAVFVFCQYNFRAENFSAAGRKIAGLLGKWSFGIYLAHVFFLEHLYRIGMPNFFCDPVISVPVTSSVVFAASLTLVFLLSKIPVLRKYVI
ncbi:MAG: acyltransferase family protein [Lentisphaeria bacterium]|nr:acyltransferase family protein [Lentisphaeria bacterium]